MIAFPISPKQALSVFLNQTLWDIQKQPIPQGVYNPAEDIKHISM